MLDSLLQDPRPVQDISLEPRVAHAHDNAEVKRAMVDQRMDRQAATAPQQLSDLIKYDMDERVGRYRQMRCSVERWID